MGILSDYLSFEKPMGATLVRILFWLGIIAILWHALREFWFWLTYLDDDWDRALWKMITTPVKWIVALMILRVVAEFVLAQFRMDKSLHDQVTGRAAPPPKAE